MRKHLVSFLIAAALATTAGTASAGGQSGSFGVGAETDLFGAGGLSLNYDAGSFHTGGYLSYIDGRDVFDRGDDTKTFQLGGRFYYHLHSTAMSDFSIGGSLGLAFIDLDPDGAGTLTNLYLQPGFQIRLFLASNVALSATGGIAVATLDAADAVIVAGQPVGALGIHYYFF